MQGMSERQYAADVGLSRGAIQKAKTAERLVLYPDGSINAAASDARRAETTDPSKTRKPPTPKLKPVPEAAVAAVGDTLREQGLAVPAVGGGTTFLQAKTANEVLKAQERRIRLQKLKGELIERARALALVFRLAREERDAWVNWPARAAALMAAELSASCSEATGQQTEGGKRLRRGARLWTVAVSTFKAETYRFLRLARPTDEEIADGAAFPPGSMHLPHWVENEWLKQFVAEQLVTVRTKRGFARLEWQKLRERNEALDCRVYARAAAWIAGADRWPDEKWRDLEDQLGAAPTDTDPAGQINRPGQAPQGKRRSDWLGRRGGWF